MFVWGVLCVVRVRVCVQQLSYIVFCSVEVVRRRLFVGLLSGITRQSGRETLLLIPVGVTARWSAVHRLGDGYMNDLNSSQ